MLVAQENRDTSGPLLREANGDDVSGSRVTEELLDGNPLVAFSVYTHLQVSALSELGADIAEALDQSFSDEGST